MDRIAKSYLENFSKNMGFSDAIPEYEKFEHFINYTILANYLSDTNLEPEKFNIGEQGTVGIDGFALIINGEPINSIEELNDFPINNHSKASLFFIQSKTTANFQISEIENFGSAVEDFINDIPSLVWSSIAKEKIDLFQSFVNLIPRLEERPSCNLFYCSLGDSIAANNDQNITSKKNLICERISKQAIFTTPIKFEILGKQDIIELYDKSGKSISKDFKFSGKTEFPKIMNVDNAYLGIVAAKEIIKIITDQNGQLLKTIYYDNVRDFQGNNAVNQQIEQTLQSAEKAYFGLFNNGITIVARKCTLVRDTCTITDFQIINGCQTTTLLFKNQQSLTDDITVPVKIIVTNDENIISGAIRSTNTQTAIKPQDLQAYSQFHKNLERYFESRRNDIELFYERRSKQYQNNANVEKKRIIDKTILVKAMASFYFDKPHLATRYFGTVYKDLEKSIFQDNQLFEPYYYASCAYYQITTMLRNGQIPKKYQKVKYHLLTLIRHEIDNTQVNQFISKNKQSFEKIGSSVINTNTFTKLVKKAINVIDELDVNIESNQEVSKSTDFVKRMLSQFDKDNPPQD